MSYVMHPWLLVAGICAVSIPVLIHLLNRRRLRVIEWAAMDLLLAADRQSRRRIRLQHWLLLLLRSLAVVLVGVLLARPFLRTGLIGGFMPAATTERIIVLDNSLSMQARWANESAWEAAKREAMDLIRRLTTSRDGKDTLTLIVTSQINQPIVVRTPLVHARIDEFQSRLDELNCSDGAMKLPDSFGQLAEALRSQDPGVNHAIYVFTDFRRRDWQDNQAGASVSSANAGTIESLQELSEQVQGCFLIDVGDDRDGNLTVTRVQPEGAILSDVRTALDVSVMNQGSAVANDIGVQLFVDDGLPESETIRRLSPGESAIVRFYSTFACDSVSSGEVNRALVPGSGRIRVQLRADKVADDLLAGDSAFYFPASVRCGIRILLVDGDPGTENAKAESFFLLRALAPAGPVKSGVSCNVVTEDDLDSLALANYDIVFLLNNSRLGSEANDNVSRLTQWVGQGGNLVLMPGDQTNREWFNSQLWQNGQGLSPLKLIAASPDEGDMHWLGLQFGQSNDLLPRLAAEPALLGNVKFFRHWQAEVANNNSTSAGRVVARFSNVLGSSAIAEKSWGDGRVVAFAMPADADWNNWPSNPSYVLMAQDLVRALVRDQSGKGLLHVGETIHQPIDLAHWDTEASIEDPTGATAQLQAALPAAGQAGSTQWEFQPPVCSHLGFYTVTLSRRDGTHDKALFAANADDKEGDLKRADLREIQRATTNSNIQLIRADEAPSLTDDNPRSGQWQYFAWLLIVVLVGEQALGWFFGRERT